ncbi:MAG: hypothetical protein AAGI72_10770 [Pseudomonadota bacterium]
MSLMVRATLGEDQRSDEVCMDKTCSDVVIRTIRSVGEAGS